MVENKIKNGAKPDFKRKTKSYFKKTIKYIIIERLLEFCQIKLVVKPVTELYRRIW